MDMMSYMLYIDLSDTYMEQTQTFSLQDLSFMWDPERVYCEFTVRARQCTSENLAALILSVV